MKKLTKNSLEIKLKVNDELETNWSLESPMLFNVDICNLDSIYSYEKTMIEKHLLEYSKPSEKLSNESSDSNKDGFEITFGNSSKPWYSHFDFVFDSQNPLKWPIKIISKNLKDEIILNSTSVGSVEFGMDPTYRIPLGDYEIRTQINLESVLFTSNPVTVHVLESKDEPKPSEFFNLIRYYKNSNQFDKSYTLSKQLYEKNPKSYGEQIAMGDALFDLEKYDQAINFYEKALKTHFEDKYAEYPSYLQRKLTLTKSHLKS